MAIPANGYADDAVVYAFARTRFPNNFTDATPSDAFVGHLTVAGDIINLSVNDDKYVGQKVAGLGGGKVWPRIPTAVQTVDLYPFLDGTTIPQQLLDTYYWLAIGIALAPEQFGTTSSSSSEIVSGGGGLSEIGYGGITVRYAQAGTDTIKRNATSVVPISHQFAFQTAIGEAKDLTTAGMELSIPGLDQDLATNVGNQAQYADLGQFNTVRV